MPDTGIDDSPFFRGMALYPKMLFHAGSLALAEYPSLFHIAQIWRNIPDDRAL